MIIMVHNRYFKLLIVRIMYIGLSDIHKARSIECVTYITVITVGYLYRSYKSSLGSSSWQSTHLTNVVKSWSSELPTNAVEYLS